jgi:hypothetical protein
LVVGWNGTGTYVYNDNVKSGGEPADGLMDLSGNPLNFGADPTAAASFFNGTLDELMIWNKSLTPEGIAEIYTQQYQRFYAKSNMTINQSISSCNRINITVNTSGQPSTNICTAVYDGTTQSSCINMTSGVLQNYTISSSATILNLTFVFNGYYNHWSPIMLGSIIIETWNETGTTPDSNPPTFSNAVNYSIDYKRYSNFTANITITDDTNLSAIIYSTNTSGSWANISLNNMATPYNASVSTNISVGMYNCWYYWANDSTGNTNSSDEYCFITQNISVSTEYPIIAIIDMRHIVSDYATPEQYCFVFDIGTYCLNTSFMYQHG